MVIAVLYSDSIFFLVDIVSNAKGASNALRQFKAQMQKQEEFSQKLVKQIREKLDKARKKAKQKPPPGNRHLCLMLN